MNTDFFVLFLKCEQISYPQNIEDIQEALKCVKGFKMVSHLYIFFLMMIQWHWWQVSPLYEVNWLNISAMPTKVCQKHSFVNINWPLIYVRNRETESKSGDENKVRALPLKCSTEGWVKGC